MVYLITIGNPRLAQSFVDYMATHNITIDMRPTEQRNEVELWLEDESQKEYTDKELQQFIHNPMDERYMAASWQTNRNESPFHYKNQLNIRSVATQVGPLTISVFVLSIIVYLWMQVSGDRSVMSYLAWPNDQQKMELWRWFTPALLHFSIEHILFNLMWWWYLGGQVERRLGAGKLFVIMIVSALFSNWGQSLFSGSNFGGLSGVVYALIGYVWLTGERNPDKGIAIPRGLMIFSVLWLVVGYFDMFGMSIANMAHASGLGIGILMALWDNRPQYNTNRK